ncbi:RING-H2 finger protein ATL78 [Capsicum annuum]|uniref:RING-H2 finger protein ATL78 n=1 Tax=Capsicum annuum TaxID=4072 RepID=UPI0007BFB225|nr:RING-H2 finger protein ATL78 [Capsicum annuum]
MATTSTLLIQEFMENFHYSRRLLTMAPPPVAGISHDAIDPPLGHKVNTIDANVIMVLAVLVCALICSLVLNSIIKCAFKCSSLILPDPSPNHTNSNPSSAKLTDRGIKKKALKTFPVITYSTELKHPGLDSECVICLSEFGIGEKVKVLPKCNHGFHVKCIDKWLNSHSSCPTCRHCLIETCQKIVNGGNSSSNNISSSAAAVQEVIVSIEPVQREGVISN